MRGLGTKGKVLAGKRECWSPVDFETRRVGQNTVRDASTYVCCVLVINVVEY